MATHPEDERAPLVGWPTTVAECVEIGVDEVEWIANRVECVQHDAH